MAIQIQVHDRNGYTNVEHGEDFQCCPLGAGETRTTKMSLNDGPQCAELDKGPVQHIA